MRQLFVGYHFIKNKHSHDTPALIGNGCEKWCKSEIFRLEFQIHSVHFREDIVQEQHHMPGSRSNHGLVYHGSSITIIFLCFTLEKKIAVLPIVRVFWLWLLILKANESLINLAVCAWEHEQCSGLFSGHVDAYYCVQNSSIHFLQMFRAMMVSIC